MNNISEGGSSVPDSNIQGGGGDKVTNDDEQLEGVMDGVDTLLDARSEVIVKMYAEDNERVFDSLNSGEKNQELQAESEKLEEGRIGILEKFPDDKPKNMLSLEEDDLTGVMETVRAGYLEDKNYIAAKEKFDQKLDQVSKKLDLTDDDVEQIKSLVLYATGLYAHMEQYHTAVHMVTMTSDVLDLINTKIQQGEKYNKSEILSAVVAAIYHDAGNTDQVRIGDKTGEDERDGVLLFLRDVEHASSIKEEERDPYLKLLASFADDVLTVTNEPSMKVQVAGDILGTVFRDRFLNAEGFKEKTYVKEIAEKMEISTDNLAKAMVTKSADRLRGADTKDSVENKDTDIWSLLVNNEEDQMAFKPFISGTDDGGPAQSALVYNAGFIDFLQGKFSFATKEMTRTIAKLAATRGFIMMGVFNDAQIEEELRSKGDNITEKEVIDILQKGLLIMKKRDGLTNAELKMNRTVKLISKHEGILNAVIAINKEISQEYRGANDKEKNTKVKRVMNMTVRELGIKLANIAQDEERLKVSYGVDEEKKPITRSVLFNMTDYPGFLNTSILDVKLSQLPKSDIDVLFTGGNQFSFTELQRLKEETTKTIGGSRAVAS